MTHKVITFKVPNEEKKNRLEAKPKNHITFAEAIELAEKERLEKSFKTYSFSNIQNNPPSPKRTNNWNRSMGI